MSKIKIYIMSLVILLTFYLGLMELYIVFLVGDEYIYYGILKLLELKIF